MREQSGGVENDRMDSTQEAWPDRSKEYTRGTREGLRQHITLKLESSRNKTVRLKQRGPETLTEKTINGRT